MDSLSVEQNRVQHTVTNLPEKKMYMENNKAEMPELLRLWTFPTV